MSEQKPHSELRTAILEGLLHERPSFSAGLEALDGLLEQLEAAAAALRWVADNYPKAMREMPTELYQPLRASYPASRSD